MGLVSKLKNILFEEEEVEIPVIEKKEKPVEKIPVFKEAPKVEEKKSDNYYDGFSSQANSFKDLSNKEEPVKERVLERNFDSQKTFNFPAFDEKEFESSLPKPRTTNVIEYEKSKPEKKYDYKRIDSKEEVREVKAKFKPSPIISPVYGILDKNYTPDEIQSREVNNRNLDVDSVRKKAFGAVEEVKEIKKGSLVENDILEEKWEKARTIDELLQDSSDEIISLDKEEILDENDFEELNKINLKKENFDDLELKLNNQVEEEALESDLFDLIDSMYENREDGE